MSIKTGKGFNSTLKSEIGLVNITAPTENYNYIITPAKKTIFAKMIGNIARCGNCNHKLGEFEKADGEILCTNTNNGVKCKTLNKIKK